MTFPKKLNTHIQHALTELDAAMEELFSLKESGVDDLDIGDLGQAIGYLVKFQQPIFELNPELAPPPPWHDEPIPELTEDEQKQVARLTEEDITAIDNKLLSLITDDYRKVAMIVGLFIMESQNPWNLADLFYRDRIIVMAENGLIEHQGNLNFMGYSEIKIADKTEK